MNKPSNQFSPKGFSLLELLAAIAIVATLCALIVPKATEWINRSKDAQCVQRLRTVQQAVLLYASDNSGRLPQALVADGNGGTSSDPFVYKALSTYLGDPSKNVGPGKISPQWQKIWWCPRAKGKAEWTEETLGYNVGLGAPSMNIPERTLGAISSPSKMAVFSCITSNYVVFPWMAYVTPSKGVSTGGQLPDWHSGGCNVVFLDGHVLQGQEITSNDPRTRWWNVNDALAP
jgi:prepilin-type N-terminal cleavage/methylation domain-containing protein/prepilin-type processing-associated H-X9-DG protein